MNTIDLVDYYAKLLIIQYIGKPRAYAHIQTIASAFVLPQTSEQTITFLEVPTSGSFKLSYGGEDSASIDWDDTASDVQTALRALTGLSDVTVTGDFENGFVVTFENVPPVAPLLEQKENTLEASATPVTITITETDETLPLAIQNAFNLTEDPLATGVQLDILGKYAGVSRTGQGFTQQITLDDDDFRSLLQMAIAKNSAGSSLAAIAQFIYDFFGEQVLVFDYKNMKMSYLISNAVGSQELIQLFITQGLLPRPMAVQVPLIIYAPTINNFFGFRTYQLPAYNATPFNDYSDYQMDWPWLSYQNAVIT